MAKKSFTRLGVQGLKPGHVPLERALSKLGLASRTQARAWILAGKVRVNGVLKKTPSFGVVPEKVKISIEGEANRPPSNEVKTFALHKPRGVITTHSDEKGRPTVFDLIKKENLHLISVGRLDGATTGLLILTNDTKLAAYLTEPSHHIPRTYVVTVRGKISDTELNQIRGGIEDEGELLQVKNITLRKSSTKESHLTVELTEGKNREIRRIFVAVGHEVTRLKRIGYGKLDLGNLAAGEYRELGWDELKRCFPEAPLRRELTL